MLREKETYKYLEILAADTIKQVKMKEKIKKEYLRKTGKVLETKLYSRNLPCKILGTILEVDERRTSTNGPENKKTDDDA